MSVREKCPDKGTCHHDCGDRCFRVVCCGPLTGVYPDDRWPAEVAAQHRGTQEEEQQELPPQVWRPALGLYPLTAAGDQAEDNDRAALEEAEAYELDRQRTADKTRRKQLKRARRYAKRQAGEPYVWTPGPEPRQLSDMHPEVLAAQLERASADRGTSEETHTWTRRQTPHPVDAATTSLLAAALAEEEEQRQGACGALGGSYRCDLPTGHSGYHGRADGNYGPQAAAAMAARIYDVPVDMVLGPSEERKAQLLALPDEEGRTAGPTYRPGGYIPAPGQTADRTAPAVACPSTWRDVQCEDQAGHAGNHRASSRFGPAQWLAEDSEEIADNGDPCHARSCGYTCELATGHEGEPHRATSDSHATVRRHDGKPATSNSYVEWTDNIADGIRVVVSIDALTNSDDINIEGPTQ